MKTLISFRENLRSPRRMVKVGSGVPGTVKYAQDYRYAPSVSTRYVERNFFEIKQLH